MFKEFNVQEDQLSQKGLSLQEGILYKQDFIGR